MGAETAKKLVEAERPQREKEFAIIRFQGKRKKTDPDIISVGVNGKKWRMVRNEYIPVPNAVIQNLRQATEPVVEEDMSGGSVNIRRRAVVNFTSRFPFELVGWISRQDFEKMHKIAKTRSITEAEIEEVI